MAEDTTVQNSTTEVEKDVISANKKDQGGDMRFEAKAQGLLERMFRSKDDLKEYKNALKAYKVTSEKMEELKKARKEFTDQINDEKTRIEGEFQKDKTYNEIREKILDCDEKIALSKQDLRVLLKEKAMENEFFEMQFDVNGIPFKLQSQAKVALYFNGKEEK
jgi:hypothetical protein